MPEPDDRYSRQVRFAPVGPRGQERLRRASAVLVGCGALGTFQADLLVRAGIGRLRIVDRDFVERTNLQRQILFDEADAERAVPKAVAAVEHLRQVNGEVALEAVVADLTPGNATGLLEGFDVILDGSDNFEVRFLINDVAVSTGRPWIYGGCVGSYGVCLAIVPGATACLACLMPEMPPPGSSPTCDTAGVLGPAAGAVACLQAAEALKILTGNLDALRRGLISMDLWHAGQQVVRVPRLESCPVCVGRGFRHLEGGQGRTLSARLCGRNAVQVTPPAPLECDLEQVAERLAGLGPMVRNPFLVRCDLGEHQLTLFRDGRAIVGGTDDPAAARAIYARYVGS